MSATKRNHGFSLVELLCAVLILGIALVGLTQGITTALSSSKDSELQTTAALIAAGLIEGLRADGFITDGTEEGKCGEGFTLYKWKQSITGTAIEGLHEVSVVVEHSETGKAIYELRTLLFDPPAVSDTEGVKSKRPESRQRDRSRR